MVLREPGLPYSLTSQLELLIKNGDWKHVASWFSYWKDDEEKIDKVLLWGKVFMSNYFRDPSPPFHRDLVRMFFSDKNEYVAAPRGFSKTTMLQLCMAFSCANRLDTFIVLVEKAFMEAAEVLNAVRTVYKEDKFVLNAYGEKMIGGTSDKDPDAKGDIVVNGVRLRAKGFDTTLRGLKSNEFRPSKIILDDVEKDEHIGNPEQRQKYMENYNRGIQPAVDIDKGSIKVFGTILHYDSLLKNLIAWHDGKIYRAYDPKDPAHTLLWPERWSMARLLKKKEDMTSDRGSSAFSSEYLNDPVSDDERTFKQSWLWRKDRLVELDTLKGKVLNGYAAIDVAESTSEGADWTGVVVHLVDSDGNHYRSSVRRERRNSLGLVDLVFELWSAWKPYGLVEIGIEKRAMEDQVRPMLDVEKVRRNIYPIISELKPMGRSKTARIRGALQGRYEMGRIWTVTQGGTPVGHTEELLDELYDFPNAKKDDLSDAEAYVADMAQIPFGGHGGPVQGRMGGDDPWETGNSGDVEPDPFA